MIDVGYRFMWPLRLMTMGKWEENVVCPSDRLGFAVKALSEFAESCRLRTKSARRCHPCLMNYDMSIHEPPNDYCTVRLSSGS